MLDVSNSFKQLQANKEAVDKVIRELTPVESVTDGEGLREHLQSLIAKDEVRANLHYVYSESYLSDRYRRMRSND